ncbi:uncharacterized protein BP01DRAFT_363823 [Aspergillus saccharolyticus JOP 1030-1]|uniref:Uncharacterized protein n=1 Tax=Aspergillus saccharolyticus JOP 1030-1 TaxID=1450539 RepID=A0A319ALD4_9EURO|nr:hypothetical protein BP01DRAFT_363823 [Aspergillus saccharolyticus JOP 1030-1]PYH47402.1 hypothetical protein BP01DRAFT_363823 [Aspergillus saccharolyticus JOP 1030-1]
MKTVDDTARELGCVNSHEEKHLQQQEYEREQEVQRREQQLFQQEEQQQQQQQQQQQAALLHNAPSASVTASLSSTSSSSSSSSSSSGLIPPTEKITEVASSSIQEVKSMLNAAYESELVNRAVRTVREYVPGLAEGAEGEQDDEADRFAASPEEIQRIDALEKERIVEFLQNRQRSTADLEKKYHRSDDRGSGTKQ